MRYCVKCGKPLESSRFCPYCGTDNGIEIKTPGKSNAVNFNATLNGINISMILNCLSILLFAVVAYLMLRTGFGQLKYLSGESILYQGMVIPAVIFFVFCIWISFPALASILNAGKNQSNKIIVLSVINVVIMIVACIFAAIFKSFSGQMEIVSMCLSMYTSRAVRIIILSVLAAGAAIFAKCFEVGER